jgi:transformer-2 protein
MVEDKESGSPRNSRSRSRGKSDHEEHQKSLSPNNVKDEDNWKLTDSINDDKKHDENCENINDNKIEEEKGRSRSKSHSRSKSRSHSGSRRKRSERHREERRRRRSRTRSRSRSRENKKSRRDSRDRRDRDSRRDRRRRSHSGKSKSPSPYHRRLNPSPCRVIGIFGLNFQTDERDLKRVFEKYGRLDKVKLVTDPRTGRSRGFAFVYMQNVDDAEEAKERIHGSEVDGNHVRCEYSISNREHHPTPGVYMGRRTTRHDDRRSRSRSRSFERRRRSYSNDRY